jgi:hypothetical protein
MAQRERRVMPLELFFDLVFVYAITQVTLLMSDNPTWRGLGAGLQSSKVTMRAHAVPGTCRRTR